jgi:hypothetical protein
MDPLYLIGLCPRGIEVWDHCHMVPKSFLTADQLSGVHEKLQRADEIIRTLNSELTAFLKPPEAGFSKNKQKAANEFLQHARRQVPPRFGIIAGEVAYHLRSSLDHIAWLLSCDRYQRSHEGAISFPILTEKPRKKAELGSYSRKVEGIQSAAARALIERLQPYHAPTPADDPLAITHERATTLLNPRSKPFRREHAIT